MTFARQEISDLIASFSEETSKRRELLSQVVADNWGPLPPWSTLDRPRIEVVQTATAGAGAVITFLEKGVRKVVLAEAGPHYKPQSFSQYMIFGGFINLSRTPGSALVPASDAPEHPRIALAREIEEELKNLDGEALIKIDPARLQPMDTQTLFLPWGERRLVLGMMMELGAREITDIRNHIVRLSKDPVYTSMIGSHTVNEETGKAEISSVAIFDLDDVAAGKVALMHKDQLSLFKVVQKHFSYETAPKGALKDPLRGPRQHHLGAKLGPNG